MLFIKSCCLKIPQRWVLAILACLGLCLGYSMSLCLSISITEMVKPINNTNEIIEGTCPDEDEELNKNETILASELYDWSEYTQGIILSSYFWGYIVSQLLGGVLVDKVGGKHTIGIGVLLSAVCTLSMPFIMKLGGSAAVIGIRIIMGLSAGSIIPASASLLSRWAPNEEKSLLSSIVFNGSGLGGVLTMLVGGLILRSWPWPTVFYVFGIISVLWFILWMIFCCDNPRDHPFISVAEANYIHESLKAHKHDDTPPIPWSYILRSPPFWALMVIQSGYGWGTVLIDLDLPKYTRSVLKLKIEDSGYLNSFPHLTSCVFCMISSWLADWMITKKKIPTSFVRKLWTLIATTGSASFFIAASYAGCNKTLAAVLLIVGITLTGSIFPGARINALDLSPNYAGSVMAVTNGVAVILNIVSPYVAGILTPNQTILEWRHVFWSIFYIFFFSGIVFTIFAKGDVQPWNDPEFLKSKNKEESIEKYRSNYPIGN